MLKKDTETLRRYLLICLIVLALLVIALLLYHYTPPLLHDVLGFLGVALTPFVFAWLAAIFTRPMVALFCRLRLPKTLAVLLTMLICFLVLGLIVMALTLVLVDVTGVLLEYFGNPENSLTVLYGRLQYLYGQVDMDFEQLQQFLSLLSTTAANLAGQGVGFAVDIVKSTPTVLLVLLVSLVAMFYWCRDEHAIKRLLAAPFPAAKRPLIIDTYDSLSQVLGNYLRAQLLLVGISIVICVAGLSIMGAPNAIPLGLLAGILDIIPMLGPGTILLPWALWMLLSGQALIGVGLAVVFAAVILVRNIVQPKILGDQVGLHPLVALAALFIGMELFGVVGLFIGPVAAALAMELYRVRRRRNGG